MTKMRRNKNLHISWRNVSECDCGNNLAVPQQVQHKIDILSKTSTPRISSKIFENRYSNKNLDKNVHKSSIHNRIKVKKITQMSSADEIIKCVCTSAISTQCTQCISKGIILNH